MTMNNQQILLLKILEGTEEGRFPVGVCSNIECLHPLGNHGGAGKKDNLLCGIEGCDCKDYVRDLDKARKEKKLISILLKRADKETPKKDIIDKLSKSKIFCVDTKTALSTFEYFMNDIAHYTPASQKLYRAAWIKFVNHCKHGKDANEDGTIRE